MLTSYRIAMVLAGLLFSGSMAAAFYGWGLPDDATLRARNSVRQGSLHGRHYMGGGPAFGK